MSSGERGLAAGAAQPRLYRLFSLFDPEAAAVVTILLGLFQVLLALPIYYLDMSLPNKLFLVPLFVGSLIVAAGSFAVTCEKSPNRQLLRGCAYMNVAGLLGALLAPCIYTYALNAYEPHDECEKPDYDSRYYYPPLEYCPGIYFSMFFRNLTGLVLAYDIIAVVLQSMLSISALKGLRAF